MFHAARLASEMAWPKPTDGRSGARDVVGAAHAPMSTADVNSRGTLRNGIAHLPIGTHQPGEDPIVMLDEPRDDSALHDVGDRRLHVAGRVHGPTLDHGRPAVPGPAVTETGEALVEDRIFERGGLPALAAIDRNVHSRDAAAPRPGEALDFGNPGPPVSYRRTGG